MKKITSIAIATAMVLGMTAVSANAAEVRSSYVVSFKAGTDAKVRQAIANLRVSYTDELDYVMDGFTVQLTASEASTLAKDVNVTNVYPDMPVGLLDTQKPVPSWGLDRVDQPSANLNSSYSYPSSGGANVKVYVVDTGVQASLPNFGGRVQSGYDATGSNSATTDCNGHGTHVAGTIASSVYGVAKKATIVPVKVIGCNGQGKYSWVLSGLDWIIANHPKGATGVVNMSIGGGKYAVMDEVVAKLHSAGLIAVVAAGNSNADACNFSPAGTKTAVTVGSIGSSDTRSYFSNHGECVDIFAPGSAIVSESVSNAGGQSMSGTSMATPHVAGAAALYLATNPTASPSLVSLMLTSNGTKNAVVDAKSMSGNVVLNTGWLVGSMPSVPVVIPTPTPVVAPAPAPVVSPSPVTTPAPSDPIVLASKPLSFRSSVSVNTKSVLLTWSNPTNASKAKVVGYVIEVKASTSTLWKKVGTSSTNSYLFPMSTIPVGGGSYRVSAVTAGGIVGESTMGITITVK